MLAVLTPKEPFLQWARGVLGADAGVGEDENSRPVAHALGAGAWGKETEETVQRRWRDWFAAMLESVSEDQRCWPPLEFEVFCNWVEVGFSPFGGEEDLDVVRQMSPGHPTQATVQEWRNPADTVRVGITRDRDGILRVKQGRWFVDQWCDATLHIVDSLPQARTLAERVIATLEQRET